VLAAQFHAAADRRLDGRIHDLKQEFNLELNLVRKTMELLSSSMTVRLGSIQVVAAGLLFAALKLS
jgi:hypothetical protein